MKTKIGINGFGRIGRLLFKMALKSPNVEVVAINDLGDIENMTYLLNYDTAQKDIVDLYGQKAEFEIVNENEKYLIVGDRKIQFFSIRNPEELPWQELGVEIVAECTGVFNSFEKSKAHLKAGAKKVILSGPTKDSQETEFEEGKIGSTVLLGINDDKLENYTITSNASCTTNAVSNVLNILEKELGVESAFLNTIHSYTASQGLVDGPSKKDFRRGRAAAQNIVPTTTGSAKAVGKVLESVKGKFDGMAVRVPTVSGSLVDLTFISKKETTPEEVNKILEEYSHKEEYKNLVEITKEAVVSTDIIGNENPAIVDLNFTNVIGKLVKVIIWYDNEAGYTQTLLSQIEKMSENL
ncbi:type I glyceraldehyde-3-phosphate dehydrogenase [Candidatus Campbellbacteria bacterium]|nr:MAG: type I glyceraldehyde-3-phosphate dehydrogenase [Candidatus Campbellbacteria bacterium]